MGKLYVVPVGYVHSDIKELAKAPRQGRDGSAKARIEILPLYIDGIAGIQQWSQLLITCWLHLAQRDVLTIHPKGDVSAPLTGIFGTRSPARPNPLAVYMVDLISVSGNTLEVVGVDAVDGTPVLDIKPHVKRLDD